MVDLTDTGLSAWDLEPLAHELRGSGVEVLRVGRNRLRAEGAAVLAEMLRRSTVRVTELDASANSFGAEGAAALAAALPAARHLRRLHIGGATGER